MQNTTVAELIQGIHDMDRKLGQNKRTGLSKMRKAELVALHTEVLDNFVKVTQPEVDKLLEAYSADVDEQDFALGDVSELEGQHQQDRLPAREQALVKDRHPGPASQRIIARKVLGPAITVVCRVGRKLVMGKVVGTVTRSMAMLNPNLFTVQHMDNDGNLIPRVTMHSADELAY